MSENDVRIYLSKKDMNKNAAEFAGNFDAVMRQRANGNIDKARRLGAALATIAPTDDGDGVFVNLRDHLSPKFFVQDILYQIRVLLVFACETMLQMELPTELLSTTAIASMYHAMEKICRAFTAMLPTVRLSHSIILPYRRAEIFQKIWAKLLLCSALSRIKTVLFLRARLSGI